MTPVNPTPAQRRALELMPIDYGLDRFDNRSLPAEARHFVGEISICGANGWAEPRWDARGRICGWLLTDAGFAVLEGGPHEG